MPRYITFGYDSNDNRTFAHEGEAESFDEYICDLYHDTMNDEDIKVVGIYCVDTGEIMTQPDVQTLSDMSHEAKQRLEFSIEECEKQLREFVQ